MTARTVAIFLVVAGLSGCAEPERYALVCEMSGPSTGTGTEYRFPIDEPRRRIGWSSAAGVTPIEVDAWTEAGIKGRFRSGETSVRLNLDRTQSRMALVASNPVRGQDRSEGTCQTGAITAEEAAHLEEGRG
jgi:hypothetical protein